MDLYVTIDCEYFINHFARYCLNLYQLTCQLNIVYALIYRIEAD